MAISAARKVSDIPQRRDRTSSARKTDRGASIFKKEALRPANDNKSNVVPLNGVQNARRVSGSPQQVSNYTSAANDNEREASNENIKNARVEIPGREGVRGNLEKRLLSGDEPIRRVRERQSEEAQKELEESRRLNQEFQRRVRQEESYQLARQQLRAEKAKKQKSAVGKAIGSVVRKGTAFLRYIGFGLVIFLYIWRMIFGIVSLVFFGIHAGFVAFENDSFLGSVSKFFGFSISSALPFEELAWVFWFFCTFIALIVFFAYYVNYKISGLKPFLESPSIFLFTSMCLIGSVMPVFNIFPFLIVWIFGLNTLMILKSFKRAVKRPV